MNDSDESEMNKMNNTDNRKKSIYSKNIYLSSVCATIGTMCVHDIGRDDDALSLYGRTQLSRQTRRMIEKVEIEQKGD